MSSQNQELVEVSIWYGEAQIHLSMEWEPGYLIKKAVLKDKRGERVLPGFQELVRNMDEDAKMVLTAHIIWLLYNFNREMSYVKNEGMNLSDKISIWVDALEKQRSPSLLAVAYNPGKTDVVVNMLTMFIDSLYEIVDYLHTTVTKHCKRLSKFLKGLNMYKKNPMARELLYEVYSQWISSELRKKSLGEYRDYGLEEINRKLLKIANPFIKSRLLQISVDPFEKVNFLAAINLRICDDVNLYISIINSAINLLEYMRESISKVDELTTADVDKIYETLDDVGDDLSKLVVNIRSLYMNLEPL